MKRLQARFAIMIIGVAFAASAHAESTKSPPRVEAALQAFHLDSSFFFHWTPTEGDVAVLLDIAEDAEEPLRRRVRAAAALAASRGDIDDATGQRLIKIAVDSSAPRSLRGQAVGTLLGRRQVAGTHGVSVRASTFQALRTRNIPTEILVDQGLRYGVDREVLLHVAITDPKLTARILGRERRRPHEGN